MGFITGKGLSAGHVMLVTNFFTSDVIPAKRISTDLGRDIVIRKG